MPLAPDPAVLSDHSPYCQGVLGGEGPQTEMRLYGDKDRLVRCGGIAIERKLWSSLCYVPIDKKTMGTDLTIIQLFFRVSEHLHSWNTTEHHGAHHLVWQKPDVNQNLVCFILTATSLSQMENLQLSNVGMIKWTWLYGGTESHPNKEKYCFKIETKKLSTQTKETSKIVCF